MTHQPVDDLPILDDGALQDLTDDAGETAAQAFMENYLLSLFSRSLRIIRVLAGGNADNGLDALLSLRTSSEMAGAVRLASYCRDVERQLNDGQSVDLTAMKLALSRQIRQVIREASKRGHIPPRHRG